MPKYREESLMVIITKKISNLEKYVENGVNYILQAPPFCNHSRLLLSLNKAYMFKKMQLIYFRTTSLKYFVSCSMKLVAFTAFVAISLSFICRVPSERAYAIMALHTLLSI